MKYRDKLPLIRELDIEGDNLQKILEIRGIINVEPIRRIPYISDTILSIIGSLSDTHRLYNSAIKISHINGSEREISNFLDDCNLQSGKAFYDFTTLLGLSNIGYHDISNYYNSLLTEKKLKDGYFFDNQMLQTAMQYGRFNNIGDQVYNNPTINRRAINLPHEPEDDFCKAFRILNPALTDILSRDLWELTTSLLLALKQLKESSPDINKFHLEIMEAWLRFIKCMDIVGHNWLSLGRVFTVYNYIINESNESHK